jgi:hypothetical protein
MSYFFKDHGVNDSDLNIAYTMAKIKSNPHDYTLSDRVIEVDHINIRNYNFAMRSCDAEKAMCSQLGLLDDDAVHYKHPEVFVCEKPLNPDITPIKWEYYQDIEYHNNVPYMSKANHMMVYAEAFLDDFKGSSRIRFAKGTLMQALFALHSLIYSKESIASQLIWACTTSDKETFDDITNLAFLDRDMRENGVCPPLGTWWSTPYKCISTRTFMEAYAPYRVFRHDATSKGLDVEYSIYKHTIYQSMLWLCEFMCLYNRLPDTYRTALAPILFAEMGDFWKNHLGNPEDERWKRWSTLGNEARYDAIVRYTDSVLDDAFWKSHATTFKEYCLSVPMLRIVKAFHQCAWQKYREQVFIIIYKYYTEKGLSLNDTMVGAETLPILDFNSDAMSSMLTLKGVGYDEIAPEFEKTATPQPKVKAPPMLDSIDNAVSKMNACYDVKVEDAQNNIALKPAYDSIALKVDLLSKQLSKQIRDIKVYNTGGKNSGKLTGRIDRHIMHRYKTDPKIFYDNTYKIKEMDLAFGIILDQSGSMRGDGIDNGRITLILMHEVLRSLRINHSIIGHSSIGTHNVNIESYYRFNEDSKHTLDRPIAIANARAHNGNCDSGALNYMEQCISRVRNKDKIVIIFSDGQPTECSEKELKEQVANMEKHGIHVIGVGIDFPEIAEYYPDNANGKNLKGMLDIVVSILKRYVLEKEAR